MLAALHELEVGADHAEGFVDDVAAAGLDHDLALFGVLRRVVERRDQALQERLLGLIGCGEFAQERDRHPVQVLAAAHRGVGGFAQVQEAEGQRQAEHQGHQQDHLLVGGDGGVGAVGRGHDPGVVGGEGLRELVLLALLEEEQVQGFLDFLLALVAEELAGLARVLGDARVGGCAGAARARQLGLGADDVVVDGGEDGAAQLLQLAVQVLDEVVLLGAALGQAVALELRGVVLVDLGLDVALLQARVGGQQGAAGVADVGGEVAGDGQLVGQVLDALAGLGAQLHIQPGGGADVGQALLALVGGDGLVHVAEFVLDHAQAVGDELVGGGGDLVLVLDPDLVVDVDHRVEDLGGALGVDVLDGQVDHGGVLVGQGRGHLGEVAARGAVEAAARHVDGALERGGLGVAGGHQRHAAQRRGERVAHGAGDALALAGLVISLDEVAQLDLAGAGGREVQARGLAVAEVQELQAQRQAVAVEGAVVEEGVLLVVGLEVQAFDDLEHQVGRLEVDDLVVDVDLDLAEAQVGEGRGHVAGDGLALGVLLDEHGGGAGVDRRGLEDVERGGQQAERQREHEPLPVRDAHPPDLGETEGLLLGLGLLVLLRAHRGIGCRCHIRFSGRSGRRWRWRARRGSARRSWSGRCCR